MELNQIIMLVTMVVTWVLGIVSKKSNWVNNNLIPIQNLAIGIIVAGVEWVITGNFSVAIALSGIGAGGTYDLFHNLNKLIMTKTNNQEIGVG